MAQYNDTNNDSCVGCKSIGSYFSLQNKICVDECKNGGVDVLLSACEECEFFNKLYFPYNCSCVEQCNEFLFVVENNICHLWNDDNRFYQDGECVDKCNNTEGYGFDTKIVLGNSTKYCMKCINDPEKRYLDR